MDGVRLVFFDAGGTLVHPDEDVGVVYARVGRRYGVDARPEELHRAFMASFGAARGDEHVQDRDWWRGVVLDSFARFGRASDPEALFDELYTHFTSPSSWRLGPGALETVEGLGARGYRTGLISNWDDRLPELLDGLGLTSRLDPIVISYRVGAEKPDPRIYETALAEAGLPAHETLMVGDDYEADVAGPRRAGMQAVLLRRPHGRPAVEAPASGPVIDQLPTLLRLLPRRDEVG